MTLLEHIRGPEDLHGLATHELSRLSAEIRRRLVETVSRNGGHLGPNLGVVELTIALHRVFSSPRDHIVFDTGHQSYVHKMLTGRAGDFTRLRERNGLSGYPSRAESAHDVTENSHASTALSYADGLAKAYQLRGETDRAVVAVVGDGAFTGGMCWEALNNIGAAPDRPIIVVLNDNGRSYAPTVGGFAAHLTALRTGRCGTLFEAVGVDYLGPVNGHDVTAVEHALREARRVNRPVLVHCVTTKGRGHPPAEADEADCLHAVSPAGPVRHGRSWTEVFGEELTAIGAERPDVVAITAAMLRPTGLLPFSRAFPDRIFDVGLAEQHAVTSAAGLALGGLHPVVAIYATFLNRAFDQALLDVALHRLPVTFVLDRAGITGPDGPSHHGMWDLPVLRVIPGLRVAAPRDATTLRAALREAVDTDGPTAIRFPKAQVGPDIPVIDHIGPIDVLRRDDSRDVLIVAVGTMADTCRELADRLAATGVGCTVVSPSWVLPVPPVLADLAAPYRTVVTVEDGTTAGGTADAVAKLLRDNGITTPLLGFGVPHEFVPHGSRDEVLASCGLSAAALAAKVRGVLTDDAREPLAVHDTHHIGLAPD